MEKYLLITGGCGYIGSHITLLFKERGYHLVVLDDLSTGRPKNKINGVTYIQGDIADTSCLDHIFLTYPISTVMHLAAKTSVEESELKPEYYYEENTIKTITLIKHCAKYRIKHFFFSSTAAIYDTNIQHAIQEEDPIHPINIYGKSKYLAELALQHLTQQYGIQLIIFRYFNVSGHHPSLSVGNHQAQSSALIPKISRHIAQGIFSISIHGNDYDTFDGTCVRDYVHVLDIAQTHVFFMNNIIFLGWRDNITVNIGYGIGLSVFDIVHQFNALLEHKTLDYQITQRRAKDIPCSIANTTKLKSLGWSSLFENPHHEIIQSEITWCKKHFSNLEYA